MTDDEPASEDITFNTLNTIKLDLRKIEKDKRNLNQVREEIDIAEEVSGNAVRNDKCQPNITNKKNITVLILM